ncbi:TPA: MBL fold metallo-hydrolase [Candidatus Nomurabacteria bacterium]|nr:MAG: ComEC/Rec2 family protein [Parcubacteria bacterium RAAC4_OD1_1]HCY26092.1 MBL fold metallo-hydrolase [Candidatus Nomurabacteria bacterium]
MKSKKRYLIIFIVLFLFFIIFFLIFKNYHKDDLLEITFIDVGQGDSILIETPNGKQVLVDGGRGEVILSKLIKLLPFFDKKLDIIINTNADEDHLGGFLKVLDYYKVPLVIESGVENTTFTYKNFQKEIEEKNIKKIIGKKGDQIILDEENNIYLDILFPDRDVTGWERNDASLVMKLVYGNTSFLLMGDATKYSENIIRWNEKKKYLDSDVLKLGHHGSDTSSGYYFLELVDPDLAIISAGKDNKYGHPDKEVLDNLEKLNIKYLGTYEEGDIVIKSDGEKVIHKK